MNDEQFKKLEALLLLNSYLLFCESRQPFEYTAVWEAVSKNYNKLYQWLSEGNKLKPGVIPPAIVWPAEPK